MVDRFPTRTRLKNPREGYHMARNLGDRNPFRHHCLTLLIHSDNQGTIGAMAKGRSPNFHINLSVRRTYTTLSSTLIVPIIVYIPSADNPADPISRGEAGLPSLRLQTSFMLPEELRPFFINAR
jgi:hypothetical protein